MLQVLDHRLDTRKKPLQFTLRVKVFPKNFSVIDDDIAQVRGIICKCVRELCEMVDTAYICDTHTTDSQPGVRTYIAEDEYVLILRADAPGLAR